MRTSRLPELLLDPNEGPFVWFMGVALIIAAFLGGVSLVVNSVGDSWAEICTQQGGNFDSSSVISKENKDYHDTHETCTPAGK